jgi:hypothetical protein
MRLSVLRFHLGLQSVPLDGKWKGKVTSQEHMPTIEVRPFAEHIATMGFAGTYTG